MLKVSWRMPLLMSGIVILIGIVSIWRAEYIGMGEGLGTDGRIYAEMARDFRGQVFDRGVWNYSADYYFQRSMPSLLIHVVLSFFSSQITDQQLLWGFSAFNLLSLIVIVFAWLRISQHLGFSERGAWLGFFLLLINVPNALVVYYYPTITDISSMLMAMLLLQAFFERKHKLVFVMTALGAFVWPVILTLGAVFYLLPNQNEAEKKQQLETLPAWHLIRILTSLAAGGGLIGLVVAVSLTRYGQKYGLQYGGLQLFQARTMIGLAVLFSYATLTAYYFSRWLHPKNLLVTLSTLPKMKLLHVILLFSAVKLVVWMVTHTSTKSSLIAVVLATTFSIRMPGLFVLKHIFYFGPAVFFLYRFWPAFFTYIAKFGPGLLFYCAMNMICGFDIESRHLGLLLPVIVCFAVSLWEKELAADKILWLLLIFSSLCFISIWFFPHLIFDGQERYHHYMWGIPNLNSMIILSILSIIFALRIRYIAGGCAKN